jgi:hypothetical protein
MTNKSRRTDGPPHFLTRNNRAVTLIGALIVFTTFVIKDAWRDHLKDKLEAIGSGEREFIVRNDSVRVSRSLWAMQSDVDEIREVLRFGKKVPAGGNDNDLESSIDESQDELKIFMDCISRLIETLPTNDVQKTRLDELRQKLTILHESFQKKYKSQVLSGDSRQWYSFLQDTWDQQEHIWWETENLGAKVVVDADDARKKSERRYRVWTWVSYALYAIRWELGVAGRLATVPGLAGGE